MFGGCGEHGHPAEGGNPPPSPRMGEQFTAPQKEAGLTGLRLHRMCLEGGSSLPPFTSEGRPGPLGTQRQVWPLRHPS